MDIILGSSRAHNIRKYLDAMHPHTENLTLFSKSSAKLAVLQEEAYYRLEHAADPTNCHIYFVLRGTVTSLTETMYNTGVRTEYMRRSQ